VLLLSGYLSSDGLAEYAKDPSSFRFQWAYAGLSFIGEFAAVLGTLVTTETYVDILSYVALTGVGSALGGLIVTFASAASRARHSYLAEADIVPTEPEK
jgi:hypothetical protein